MAGKKGRSGGPRQGAGRMAMADEENVKAVIKQALLEEGPDTMMKVWKSIIKKAVAGSDKHSQILLNYYHGKPKENLEQPTELVIHVKRG